VTPLPRYNLILLCCEIDRFLLSTTFVSPQLCLDISLLSFILKLVVIALSSPISSPALPEVVSCFSQVVSCPISWFQSHSPFSFVFFGYREVEKDTLRVFLPRLHAQGFFLRSYLNETSARQRPIDLILPFRPSPSLSLDTGYFPSSCPFSSQYKDLPCPPFYPRIYRQSLPALLDLK